MAVGAVAIGGAIVGGALGWGVGMTMAGIALGWSIGMYAGQQLYGEESEGVGDMEGPRLSDLSVQSSAYGEPIPIVYGSVRTAGNIIWSAGIQEHKKEEGGGGGGKGGGGGGGTRTTYTYTVSFAVGVCEGVIVGINRIWMDGKLFQDANQGDFISGVQNAGKVSSLSVYTGTEDQEPDPVIESKEGKGNVPGYRGLAYVVFEDLELEDYVNRIPNIEFEVALGLQEQDATFEVPEGTNRIAFFSNGYIAAGNTTNWVQVLDTKGNLLFKWEGVNSDYLIPFQCSPRASQYLSKEMALYFEHSDDDFIIVDAATGETLVEDSNFWDAYREDYCAYNWPNNDCVENPNGADIGWLEEFGWYMWVISDRSSEQNFRLINWSTGGRALGWVDTIYGNSNYKYGEHNIWVFNDKIYIAFQGGGYRILFEYNSWYDIGVLQDDGTVYADVNSPGNYNRKSDVSNTSNAGFAAVTPHGDFVTRSGTTCYLHDGIGPEIQKGFTYDTGDTSAQSLDAIVADIMDRENLDTTEYDVSDLSGISLIGFAITKSMSAKDALKPLMQAYQFDVVEAEGQIKFLTRGRSVERSFVEDDLAAHEQGGDVPPAVTTTRAQENELPTKVIIGYQDQNADYQVATQYAKRVTQDHFNKKNIRLPIVMTASEALQIAETYLATAWAERSSHSIAVLSENLDLLPGSVLDVAGYRMIAGQMSIKMPGLIEIEGPSEEPSSYQSDSTAISPEVIEQSLPGPPPSTFAIMMNLPGMERAYSTPGFFVAPYSLESDNWAGATIYATNDNGDTWYEVDSVISQTLVASVLSAPGSGPTTRWDHINSITIRSINDKADLLKSASELSVLGGTNLAALGTSSGEWELLSFLDVVDNGDGTYTLSGLLRGRRGTEDAVSANKSLFVLMRQDSIGYVPLDANKLGNEYDYKVVSVGGSAQAKTPKPWTSEGDTIKPWSPVHIEGTRNSSDDLTITWLRRSRGEESWNRAGVPLLEQNEEYEVDILDSNGDVVRTLSASGTDSDQSGVTYTATQQVNDFGSVQGSVTVEVYQISDTVGRGFPGKATV